MTKKPPPSFRVGKLKTIQDVNYEVAKLYRRTVHGHIDSADAARQSSILANLRQGLRASSRSGFPPLRTPSCAWQPTKALRYLRAE